MSRQVEQALYSLMPAHGSDLPQSLVGLAESLLSQSRLKASTLKAEEEVARLYACAHLACDRLKIALDLPPILPRAPAPPRVYKRLYSHLDNILPSKPAAARSRANKQRTPNSKSKAKDEDSEARPLPSRGTPTREQSLAQFRTPSKTINAKPAALTTRIDASQADSVLKPWIKPVIRFICLETEQPKRAPTLIAAMEHIIAPSGRRTSDEWVGRHLTSLLAAIFHTVQARFDALAAVPVDFEETRTLDNKQIMALLSRARREIKVRDLEEDEAWAGWTGLSVRDFDAALAKVSKQQDWLDSDWYKGIDDVVRTGDAEMLDGEDADLDAPIQARRVDTMFQERYDFLSEARREHYKTWKGGMLARISQMREAQKQNTMEVDA